MRFTPENTASDIFTPRLFLITILGATILFFGLAARRDQEDGSALIFRWKKADADWIAYRAAIGLAFLPAIVLILFNSQTAWFPPAWLQVMLPPILSIAVFCFFLLPMRAGASRTRLVEFKIDATAWHWALIGVGAAGCCQILFSLLTLWPHQGSAFDDSFTRFSGYLWRIPAVLSNTVLCVGLILPAIRAYCEDRNGAMLWAGLIACIPRIDFFRLDQLPPP